MFDLIALIPLAKIYVIVRVFNSWTITFQETQLKLKFNTIFILYDRVQRWLLSWRLCTLKIHHNLSMIWITMSC